MIGTAEATGTAGTVPMVPVVPIGSEVPVGELEIKYE
jgi:hypothetical protein